MIIGTLVTNIRNNQILARMREPVYNEKIEFFLLEFMNSATKKTGILTKELYKYIYTFNEDNYYVLITSIFFNEVKGMDILNHIISHVSVDPLDLLVAVDNMIFGENVVYPNLPVINSMDSQEEKIYNMMMKNKELEVRRKQKDVIKNKSVIKNKGVSIKEEIHRVQQELTRANLADLKLVDNSLLLLNKEKEKKKRFETSSSPVFICFKERLRCSLDLENNLKTVECLGEMTLNIKEEKFKSLEVHLKGNLKDCKFSPKLDKEACTKGVLRSGKDFSINKNIALLKWKDSKIQGLPLEFTFWPSEVRLNTYQISLEFTAGADLDNLVITIPKGKISEWRGVEGLSDSGNSYEWNVGSVSKGDSDSLEFQCKSSDPNKVFPMEVYFTSSDVYRDIEVEKVICKDDCKEDCKDIKDEKDLKEEKDLMDDCVEVKKVLEVDSFTIESE